MEKNLINNLPSSPGVYFLLNEAVPIYIGKATNIRARLRSHINNAKFNQKERMMIDEATKIEYSLTDSDFRALILETNLICKHKPKYNVRGRDTKSYLYIKITVKDTYPKIFSIRKSKNTNQFLYFGPFSNQKVVLFLIRYLRKIFPFCTQRKISSAGCFYSKIGLCSPCPNIIEKIKDIDEKRRLKKIYKNNINQTVKLLEGKIDPVINQLYKKLRFLSKKQEFEAALLIRNQITKLEYLVKNQSFSYDEDLDKINQKPVLSSLLLLLKKYFFNLSSLKRIEAVDISNYLNNQVTGSLIVYKNGFPDKSSYRRFKIKDMRKNSDFARINEVLNRRFKNNWPKPQLIIIDGGSPQVRLVKKSLFALKINIPVIGIAKAPDRLVIGSDEMETIKPSLNHRGFNLIRQIRDESHRFAHKYHLLLRSRDLSLS